MPKKIMKISSIFKNKESKQPWQYWPLCVHPKTLSFRASNDEAIFKLVQITPTPEMLLVNSLECDSFSTDHHETNESSFEVVISEVRLSSSERLFFEPNETSSIVEEAKGINCNNHHGMFVFKDSVALEMESDDPYLDFKKSMQEMVESIDDQGNNSFLKDNWDYLEELLGWYLRLNSKMNHGFIVEAFVDLLIGLAHASASEMKNKTMLSCSKSTSYSSASSSFSSRST